MTAPLLGNPAYRSRCPACLHERVDIVACAHGGVVLTDLRPTARLAFETEPKPAVKHTPGAAYKPVKRSSR